MTPNEKSISGLAKGLLVGTVLGAAVAMLYAPRGRNGHRRNLSQDDAPSQPHFQPISTSDVEQINQKGKHTKSGTGWLVMYYVASAVAMFSGWRMKKR